MLGLFRFLSLPYLRRRPLKTLLTILGMAAGIAVFTSIHIANQSVMRGLQYSLELASGRSDLAITGRAGLRDGDFARILELPELTAASPVVEGRAACETGVSFTLLGIDPISGLAFLNGAGSDHPQHALPLLTQPSISVSPTLATQCGFEDGKSARLQVGAKPVDALVLFQKADGSQTAPLAFADIATVQEWLDKPDKLDRVEVKLRVSDIEAWKQRHHNELDSQWLLHTSSERSMAIGEIVKAFQLNLTALGLVSIFVAGFIVYNAASLSVLYRRTELGNLRALGATRRQIVALFFGEILIFGCLSSGLGILWGWGFAHLVFSQVLQTVRDLYLAQAAGQATLTLAATGQAFAVGIGASLIGAALPLWEATRITPIEATRRLSYEKRLRHRPLFLLGLAGFTLLAAGGTAKLSSMQHPTWGFAAALFLLLGFLLLTPFILNLAARGVKGLAGVLRQGFAQVAAAQILENPYRYSVVTAAFSLAVALWIGIGAMISSFRQTVTNWIDTGIRGDIYLTLQDNERGRFESFLPSAFIDEVKALPQIAFLDSLRQIQIEYAGNSFPLSAIELRRLLQQGNFKILSGSPTNFSAPSDQNAPLPAAVAESLARRKHWRVGDQANLSTPWGNWPIKIGAVLYDYSSERGLIYLDRKDFEQRSGETAINHLALYLKDPSRAAEVIEQIDRLPGRPSELRPLLNAALKQRILDIFEQTFRLTEALKYVALIVAFLGILSTLVLLLEEKRREVGLLQALGMTPPQLSGFALTQGITLAFAGEVLGIAAGLALCQVLLKVIHRNFFGWTIFFHWDPSLLATSLTLTLATGILASSASLYWLRKIKPAQALRMEE